MSRLPELPLVTLDSVTITPCADGFVVAHEDREGRRPRRLIAHSMGEALALAAQRCGYQARWDDPDTVSEATCIPSVLLRTAGRQRIEVWWRELP